MIRRGNPTWGKPRSSQLEPVIPSAFEQVVTEWGLQPGDYRSSSPLQKWAQQNRNSRYVPEALLKHWGLTVEY